MGHPRNAYYMGAAQESPRMQMHVGSSKGSPGRKAPPRPVLLSPLRNFQKR